MSEEKCVELDFQKCVYIGELYQEMRTKMKWADWYGENLDALWDILTGLPYEGEQFIILRPRFYTGVPHEENAAFTEYVDKICAIFQQAQLEGEFSVSTRYAEDGTEIGDYQI